METREAPIEKFLTKWGRFLGRSPRSSGSGWKDTCPGHKDVDPSLAVRVRDDGKVMATCYAFCDLLEILNPLGLEPRDLYPNSSRGPRKNPKVEKILQVWRAAQLVPWPGAAGGTQWEVLRAHTQTALKAARTQAWEDTRDGITPSTDRTTYHLSVREAGLEAGVACKNAVKQANEALAETGWVVLDSPPTDTHAAVWELTIPVGVSHNTPLRSVSDDTHSLVTLRRVVLEWVRVETADYWRRGGGLGPHAHRIYLFLQLNGPVRPLEIVSGTGISRPSVYRLCKVMADLEMVRRHRDGAYEALDFDEAKILEATGTLGASDRQRARILEDRSAWKRYKEERYGERADVDAVTGEIETPAPAPAEPEVVPSPPSEVAPGAKPRTCSACGEIVVGLFRAGRLCRPCASNPLDVAPRRHKGP